MSPLVKKPGPRFHRSRIPVGEGLEHWYRKGVAVAAKHYGVSRSCIYYWRSRAEHRSFLEAPEPLQSFSEMPANVQMHTVKSGGVEGLAALDKSYGPGWEKTAHPQVQKLVEELRREEAGSDAE